MGYLSRITGELVFSRSLKRSEFAPIQSLLSKDIWNVFVLEVKMEEREIDEGTLTVVCATGLTAFEEEGKAYEWKRVLQEVVALMPGDVRISGYFERQGEGHGDDFDLERLYVRGREVVSIKPKIVWPEMD